MQSGTLQQTWTHNSRLQMSGLAVGPTAGAVLTLGLDYGGTTNNGNLMAQSITRGSTVWQQVYGYDSLNRLQAANERLTTAGSATCPDAASTWCRGYAANQAGNLWLSANTAFPPDTFTPTASSNFDAGNHLKFGTSVVYDNAGNQTTRGGLTAVYDGEGRLMSSTLNGITTTYLYDGDGRRVQKQTGSAKVTYVYDAQGRLMAEYDTAGAAAGSACAVGPCYVAQDHLGSTRAVLNSTGTVQGCHDYAPFGEELTGLGGRTGGCWGATDTTRKFTGKERDSETGLDYFGARYFSGAQGRFTSPDPQYFQAEMLTDPQRFNLYAYGRNNPLKFVDPTGKEIELIGDEEQRKKALALLQKGVGAVGSQLAVKEKKGFLGLGKTHYMVEIQGDAKKFASANGAAGDLAQIVQHSDTVQVGIAGGNESLNAVSGRTTLNQENYNGITGFFDGVLGGLGADLRSYIKNPAEGPYGNVPGYKMEDGQSAEANPMFTLFHELGHAWGVMRGRSNPQIVQDALDLENKVRKVQNPKAADRVVH